MSSLEKIRSLRNGPPAILPSLLLCDFGHLAQEVRAVEAAGARALHLDVMDGHFVPNMTYGMTIVQAVRAVTELPLDVHLMISEPERYIDEFVDAGADVVTIHAEATDDPGPLLQQIRTLGAGAGLALNPPTPLTEIAEALPLCDLVLVMSVMPGYGGQKFDPVALEKLRALRPQLGDDVLLEVDGGVNIETISQCAAAGAQLLVAGSAIFAGDQEQYGARITALTDLAAGT